MDNPFKILTQAFQADYRVNFSVERLDGSIMLTLSDEDGLVAKRMISAPVLKDIHQLDRLIQSVRFGIAIERGHTAPQMLTTMIEGGAFDHVRAAATKATARQAMPGAA
ncbi:DUF3509 domain-containing protein [Pseudomonas sp. Marseille-QA0892]